MAPVTAASIVAISNGIEITHRHLESFATRVRRSGSAPPSHISISGSAFEASPLQLT